MSFRVDGKEHSLALSYGTNFFCDMMTMIRDLSVGENSTLFAAAEFEKLVHIYRLSDASCFKSIETVMDGGGRRVAIVPLFDRIIAGAYNRYGICCYSISTGEVLWARKDLKKVQRIEYDEVLHIIVCTFLEKPIVKISPIDGSTIEVCKGVKELYFSRFDKNWRLEIGKNYKIVSTDRIHKIEALSFAALGVTFSPDAVSIAEAGGPVRVIDLDSGVEIGRFLPSRGSHFLSLNYCDDLELFVGYQWGYQGGGMNSLVHFNREAREVRRIHFEDGHYCKYIASRRSILTWSGKEYSWSDGTELFRYNFPLKETPI